MPTVSEVLGGVLQHAIENPKTTMQSVLTCVLVAVPCLLTTGAIHGKLAAVLGGLFAVAKVYVGASQSDGLKLPGNSTLDATLKIRTPPEPPAV